MNIRIYSPWKKFTNIWMNEYICLNIFDYIRISEYLSRTGILQKNIYGRTWLDGYLTKKMGICALINVHIVDYSTTLEAF